MDLCEIILTEGNRSARRKSRSIATVSTTNATRTGLGLTQVVCGMKPAS